MNPERFRACLFGGAVFAAGVAATPAHADRMAMSFSRGQLRTQVPGGSIQVMTEQDLSGPVAFGVLAYAAGDLDATLIGDSDELSIVHTRDSGTYFSYTSASVTAEFFVLGDGTFELSWDFGGWDGFGYISDVTNGGSLFDFDASINPVGTIIAPFADGVEYAFVAVLRGNAAGGDGFASLRVVEPCLADINGDGALNLDDIDAFVAAFLGGC